ncbi:hypothetical protein [Streptomyces sp. NPDC086787]|uniref:hypothetical protein n=1 Tax=Streptomyces sp. NPDC086787 TaxID=3365759 RepID=UPI00380E0B65
MGRRRTRTGVAVAAGMLLVGVAAVPARADTPVDCVTQDLIDAINDSNAGANDHILVLTSYCVYTLTDANGQLPMVTQPLVIHGNHATIRRDPAATTNFRIFEVGGTSLTMDTLTVMNGNATGDLGGGLKLTTSSGSLTATNVNFQGNTAAVGGAISAFSGGSVSLTGGTVNDNRADSEGGGIASAGAIMLDSVAVTGNRSISDSGGLILLGNQPATITNSTIDHNTAKNFGGGITYQGSGPLSVTGASIADNRVTDSGAGGGGVFFEPEPGGTLMITGSTVSGNTVTGFTANDGESNRGGGIYVREGQATLDSTTVRGNQLIGAFGQGAGIAAEGFFAAGTLTLQNGTTLLANLASGRYSQGGGLYTDNSFNPVTVAVNASHIDTNKVTGTGSAAAGIYNNGGTYSFTTSSVNNNTAPLAPAPGGVYTTVAITSVDAGTTFTGNTPTNCVFSPAPVTGCVG